MATTAATTVVLQHFTTNPSSDYESGFRHSLKVGWGGGLNVNY